MKPVELDLLINVLLDQIMCVPLQSFGVGSVRLGSPRILGGGEEGGGRGRREEASALMLLLGEGWERSKVSRGENKK